MNGAFIQCKNFGRSFISFYHNSRVCQTDRLTDAYISLMAKTALYDDCARYVNFHFIVILLLIWTNFELDRSTGGSRPKVSMLL